MLYLHTQYRPRWTMVNRMHARPDLNTFSADDSVTTKNNIIFASTALPRLDGLHLEFSTVSNEDSRLPICPWHRQLVIQPGRARIDPHEQSSSTGLAQRKGCHTWAGCVHAKAESPEDSTIGTSRRALRLQERQQARARVNRIRRPRRVQHSGVQQHGREPIVLALDACWPWALRSHLLS